MPGSDLQTSFSYGEVAPAFYNRGTSEHYRQAAKNLTNFLVTAYGSALKRKGTEFYLDVTSKLVDNQFRFLTLRISSPDDGTVPVGMILTQTFANLFVFSDSPTIQTLDLSSVYTEEQLQEAYFISADNTIIILHKAVAPHRITFDGSLFSLVAYNFYREPTFDLKTVDYSGDAVYIEAPSGSSNITKVHIQNINFTSDWVGGVIIGPGPDATNPFGAGRISTVTVGTTDTTFEVLATSPFLTASGYSTSALTGADLSIQQPVFSDTLGYPSRGVYYKNRIWFTGHPQLPLTIFGSSLGKADNFNVGVGLPTDAIIYTMQQQRVGDILFLNVGKHLEVFTEKAEFSVPETTSAGLTPGSFELKRQTNRGISTLASPVSYQEYTFFAGKNNKSIFRFEQAGGLESSYISPLVSSLAYHLIKTPRKLAIFYGADGTTEHLAVLNLDNSVAVYSYNGDADIQAWTPFSFSSGIDILDMSSSENILYFVTYYQRTGVFAVERLDFSTNVPVDSAIPVEISASPTPPVVSGLDNLNGYSVGISNGTMYLGSYTVENGSITLDKSLDEDFTGFAGLVYQPYLVPLDVLSSPEYVYNYKSVGAVYIDYVDSLAVRINGDLIPYQNFKKLQEGDKIELQSGTFEYYPQVGWARYSSFEVTQTAPVGLEIVSFGYKLIEGGI